MKNNKKNILIRFITILLIAGIIYFIRDDLFLYLNNKTYSLKKDINVENSNLESNIEDKKKEIDILKPVNSGALKIIDEYLDEGITEKTLSYSKIIELTNQQRKINGNLSPLIENPKLNYSAEKKVQDMLVKQYFDHQSPSNVGVSDLVKEASYEYILIGENLAMGNFLNEESVVQAWMASPGHRTNILNKNYTEIGVSLNKGEFEGKNVWMIVQHFGLPQYYCPGVDPVLKEIINYNQDKINVYEEQIQNLLEDINNNNMSSRGKLKKIVDEYNQTITIYNDLLKEIEDKINTYNDQVEKFNKCILELTN